MFLSIGSTYLDRKNRSKAAGIKNGNEAQKLEENVSKIDTKKKGCC